MVRPTKKQNIKIQKKLRKKYPHMGTEKWISRLKRNVARELRNADTVKRGENPATRNLVDKLRHAQMSDKEIKKFMGKK